jgi:hypothetical protein
MLFVVTFPIASTRQLSTTRTDTKTSELRESAKATRDGMAVPTMAKHMNPTHPFHDFVKRPADREKLVTTPTVRAETVPTPHKSQLRELFMFYELCECVIAD